MTHPLRPLKPTKRFYVYVLYDGDTPFYVGKGTGRRINAHWNEARREHKCPKCSKIRKIWREGREVSIRYVYQTDVESRAFTRERELIAQIGSENLTNLTYGGEGQTKYVSPQEQARGEADAAWVRMHLRDFDRRRAEERKRERARLIDERLKNAEK